MQEAFLNKELLDTEDVAGYLRVSPVTIWRWCRDGSLPWLKIGRSWRIRRAALEAFLERGERSETLADWPGMELGRAQVMDSGTVWLSGSGLALSRVTPPPSA